MRKVGEVKKIVLTGGHAGATAYAFVQALKKDRTATWDFYWIGSKSATEGESLQTFEQKVLPSLGVKVFSITSGRIQRRFTRYTIPSILKIPIGFIQSFNILKKIKPDIVLSFGGFASFPVVVVAYLFRIPIIIHEQTMVYGRANKVSSIFASKIALARKESIPYFNKNKSVVVGNPVSDEILGIKPKHNLGNPPTIFITGGARGSEDINEAVEKILPRLLSKYRVIHQTGLRNEEKYRRLKTKLDGQYQVFGLMSRDEVRNTLGQADLVISRAGANIVSELMVVKCPSILIPIPWTFMDEQTKNALYAQDFGVAKVLMEDKLSETSLLNTIEETFQDWDEIVMGVAKKKSPDLDASFRLMNLVSATLKAK